MQKIKAMFKNRISFGMKKIFKIVPYLVIASLVGFTAVYATSKLVPPGAPANTMYSLEDIYNLAHGTPTSIGTGPFVAGTLPVSETGKTLTEVYTAVSDALASGGGLLKTGQTTCYDVSGNPIADCTGTGQDGEFQKGKPASGPRFVDNTNGTITDSTTGLTWQKCTQGQTGTNCDGSGSADDYNATTMDWPTALTTCNTDATNGGGWRLPNIRELESIVDYSVKPDPSPAPILAIDTTFFPNTVSAFYWTSTTYEYPSDQSYAWGVYFNDGSTYVDGKTTSDYVRCVRG
jgi:hypothetical protein